ncbi:MAG TPA: F0F1 ATP synthase subunit delta [Candidatus Saccharimonadia bacterium]|nr:F0F1 ATP synthase subunit delta [Candidatus Saccharimonadia bacterium]
MAFELPSAVYSPELLDSVSYELEQYLAWYQQARVQHRSGVAPAAEPSYSAETAQTIEAWLAASGKKPTIETIEALLAHLRGLKLPTAHIMLATLPNHAQRAQLVDWFRRLAGRPLLVAFVADRNLGGGIVVRTPNRIFDYSWRQRLTEGRSKLAEIVNRA